MALWMGVPASRSSFPILGAGALRASHLDTTDEPLQGMVPQIGTELKVPRREQASGLLEDCRKDEGDLGVLGAGEVSSKLPCPSAVSLSRVPWDSRPSGTSV